MKQDVSIRDKIFIFTFYYFWRDEHNLSWNNINNNASHNLGSPLTKWTVEEYNVCEKIKKFKNLKLKLKFNF